MNSKCRKSNLVARWYILLFAYLPAPVVSSCISGLGTSNAQRYAYIFFLFSITVSFFLSRLPLSPSYSCPSIPLLYLLIPPLHPSTHLTHPFSLCLPQTSGCISPPAGCMTGEQVERRANDKSLSLRLPPASPSLHLTHCPARGPPQPSFLPPSSTFPSYLTTLIFKSTQAAFHLLFAVKVSSNHQRRKKVGYCPHPDF